MLLAIWLIAVVGMGSAIISLLVNGPPLIQDTQDTEVSAAPCDQQGRRSGGGYNLLWWRNVGVW